MSQLAHVDKSMHTPGGKKYATWFAVCVGDSSLPEVMESGGVKGWTRERRKKI